MQERIGSFNNRMIALSFDLEADHLLGAARISQTVVAGLGGFNWANSNLGSALFPQIASNVPVYGSNGRGRA